MAGAPPGWRETLAAIRKMRARRDAPVDTMGCHMLADKDASPRDRRLQTLVALVLSAQTRDEVTAAAMARLHARCAPLTAAALAKEDPVELATVLCPVGFYRRKAQALVEIGRQCAGDIPKDVAGLTALPGVGPKIAHLAVQVAWGRTEGIGVDVHVDRIARRLGWSGALYRRRCGDASSFTGASNGQSSTVVQHDTHRPLTSDEDGSEDQSGGTCNESPIEPQSKRKKVKDTAMASPSPGDTNGGSRPTAPKATTRKSSGPEETRADLEDWLPREHWREINALLVGFGQTVCLPRNPRCAHCLLSATCPSSTVGGGQPE